MVVSCENEKKKKEGQQAADEALSELLCKTYCAEAHRRLEE